MCRKTASLRLRLANGQVVVLFAIAPAGGISAASSKEREIRHVLVLSAAFGQAEQLACIGNVQRVRGIR